MFTETPSKTLITPSILKAVPGELAYTYTVIVADSGERLQVPLRPDGEFEPSICMYLTVDRRPTNPSSNGLGKDCQCSAMMMNVFLSMDIDILDRVRTGQFLSRAEIARFTWAMGYGVNATTRAAYLSSCLRYLRFQADLAEERLGLGAVLDRFARRADKFFASFCDVTRPPSKGDGARVGLVGEERAEFVRIISSQVACEAIWPTPFVALRNRTFMITALCEGHRRDELLNLRKGDIDFETGRYWILRRPGDIADPRRNQPVVKGFSRELGMASPALTRMSEMLSERDRLPLAGGHDYAFTTDDGSALSRSAVNKMFQQFRAVHKFVGPNFCPHVLRHTWNLDFSAYADAIKLDPEKEMRARMYRMGWRSQAAAATYTARHDRAVADEVSMNMQAEFLSFLGKPGESEG